MRKIFLIAFVVLGFAGLSNLQAQEVGVRFGNGVVGDVALDAVFAFGKFSRVHADVAFGDDQIGVSALLDFIYIFCLV